MRYSTKMKIGSYIAGIITIILFISAIIGFILNFQKETKDIAGSWFLLVFAAVSAAVGARFFEKSTENFIKKSEEFSSKINYCYYCGHKLNGAFMADRCPKCNSKINLLDIIDV